MKKYILLSFVALAVTATANNNQPSYNSVEFTLSAEQWAKTDSAMVQVSVDAVLNNQGIAAMRSEIMSKLNRIAKSDWHIVAFDRSEDQSGLERLAIQAQGRVSETALTDLYTNAKSITKPGQTYRIVDIQFTPTMAEIEKTKADVRAQLYDKAKQEIARLDQTFPDQHYLLKQMQFQPMAVANGQVRMMLAKAEPESTTVAVSTKVTQTAQVTLGTKLSDNKDT